VDDAVDVRTNPGLINAIVGIGKGADSPQPNVAAASGYVGYSVQRENNPNGVVAEGRLGSPDFCNCERSHNPVGVVSCSIHRPNVAATPQRLAGGRRPFGASAGRDSFSQSPTAALCLPSETVSMGHALGRPKAEARAPTAF
jgi:hypothetical protein